MWSFTLNAFLILTLMYGVDSAGHCFPSCPGEENCNVKKQSERDATNRAVGIPFRIVSNVLRGESDGERGIFVLIDPEHFTAEGIEKVFTFLAGEFGQPPELTITAFSNREMLERAIRNFKAPGAVHFADTPEGRQSARRWAESESPLKKGYFRAYLRRRDNGQETLEYSPDPDKEGYTTLLQKEPASRAYSGKVASDLLVAIENGDTPTAKTLIARGADPNARRQFGETALMLAASGGWPDVVRALVDAGADVNAKGPDGYTPLMYSLARKHADVAQVLLEDGADVNARSNKDGPR